MDIVWLGHAAVRIRSGNTALVMDPYPPELGLRVPPAHATASVVTISSSDPMHSAVHALEADPPPLVIDGPGEYQASRLNIRGVRTKRGPEDAPEPSWNTVYAVEAEGLVVCHLGTPSSAPTDDQIEELSSPQVLIVPAGAREGLPLPDLVELVNTIGPRVVIPVMYAHPGNKQRLNALRSFLQAMGASASEPQSRLNLTRASIPQELQVALLQPVGVE